MIVLSILFIALVSLPYFVFGVLDLPWHNQQEVVPTSSWSSVSYSANRDQPISNDGYSMGLQDVNSKAKAASTSQVGPNYTRTLQQSPMKEPSKDALYSEWKHYLGCRFTQKITTTYRELTNRPQRTTYDRIAKKCTYAMALDLLSNDPARHRKAVKELEPKLIHSRGRASDLLKDKKDEVTRKVMDIKGLDVRQARYYLNKYIDVKSAKLLMSDDMAKVKHGVKMVTSKKESLKGKEIEKSEADSSFETSTSTATYADDVDFQALDEWLKEKDQSNQANKASNIDKLSPTPLRKQTPRIKLNRRRLEVYQTLTGLSESRSYAELRLYASARDLIDLASLDSTREIRATENMLKAKKISFNKKARGSIDESMERIEMIKGEISGRNMSVLDLDTM